jgi:peptide methionine sulfoxide reductase msrA/msrB
MIVEIVFAAGCFWGVEKNFEKIPGVIDVKSGYVGGNYENPTYKTVLKYRKSKPNDVVNYTESVHVTFDNTKVTANELIKNFWEIHDPTQKNGQGNDIGDNYRSAVYYTNDVQKNAILKTKAVYQTLLTEHGYKNIVTEIKPLNKFYDAEKYHQDYLKNNPNGYCPDHSTGVKFSKSDIDDKKEQLIPMTGKEIVVIESDHCPYCERFKKDVLSSYKGTVNIRTAYASQMKKFKIETKLFATPTILFIEDGKEILANRGYMDEKSFYKMLGDFKLGKNTESYKVAFDQGTDGRFCKEYDIFKNTPDGVFVDKLSGDILFDTQDRFNSKTGWLSFFKAVDGSTVELPDNSYGMKRIEIRAKKSGIHLGHVFPRADGRQRFCINATVLEFVPRAEIKK